MKMQKNQKGDLEQVESRRIQLTIITYLIILFLTSAIIFLLFSFDYLIKTLDVIVSNVYLRILFGLLIVVFLGYLMQKDRDERLKNRQLFEELETARNELDKKIVTTTFIADAVQLLVRTRGEQTLRDLVRRGLSFYQADGGALILGEEVNVLLSSQQVQDLPSKQTESSSRELAAKIELALKDKIGSVLFSSVEQIESDDVWIQKLKLKEADEVTEGNYLNVVAQSVYAGNEKGLFAFWKIEPGVYFDQDGMRAMEIVAGEIETAMMNLRLKADRKEILEGVVRAFALSAEAKDSCRKGHAFGVAQHAVEIAERLHLPETTIEHIEIAALLHDVGLLLIDERILNKKQSLTETERQIMQRHVMFGEEILKMVKLPNEIVEAVAHHHERYDGFGYPNGLKGEKTPLSARIIAVADVFDALTNARSYRNAFSREEALADLQEGSGSQFDPKVVEVFINARLPRMQTIT